MYNPFYILNVYAPSRCGRDRKTFFNSVLEILYSLHDTIDIDRLIISGDFNYSYLRESTLLEQTSSQWISFLSQSYTNIMETVNFHTVPTFRRNDEIMSTIDYIFVSPNIKFYRDQTDICILQPSWSDHSLLQTSFEIGRSNSGPLMWRANPIYCKNKQFQKQLSNRIPLLLDECYDQLTDIEMWEKIKE
ncbi:hypothetical protein BDB01DRAFT_715387 [Pilobolus umbonatus]|nr:hypothetical protein BDB01DRAFT_715387 [Pilobolus umbonatus]